MKKSVLLGVSISAILSATGANAAGYTCEELIEYTSCMPGYYLKTTDGRCPAGYEYATGICDATDAQGEWFTDLTKEECMSEEYSYDPEVGNYAPYYEEGCVQIDSVSEHINDFTPLISSSVTSTCLTCPAGSTCAGNTADAILCPAGSYCATAGLSQPTNQCAKGTYSGAGATACTSCPTTGLTDINGAIVNATTLSTGSTSIGACVIDSNAQFKDAKGTYHFKSNCAYSIPTFEEACLEYQKTNPDAECDFESQNFYCDWGSGWLTFDPETGGIGCHPTGSVCGDPVASQIKITCPATGGTYDPMTTQCTCPAGKHWECGSDAGITDPAMEYEWGCF